MSPTTKRLTVDQYDQMVENGILPQTNRLELIEGRIVDLIIQGQVVGEIAVADLLPQVKGGGR